MNEFLLFNGDLVPTNGIDRTFYRADVNVDATLSFDEFKASTRSKTSLVNIRRNFLRADVDESQSITLEEYTDLREGVTEPVDFTIFELADLDANGELTVEEFDTWFGQKLPDKVVHKRFAKLYADADGSLTTEEWNPGVND